VSKSAKVVLGRVLINAQIVRYRGKSEKIYSTRDLLVLKLVGCAKFQLSLDV
jgi:hypothetical protein